MRSSISAIILCGGKGKRSGSPINKVLCYFGTKTALEYCLDAFAPYCDRLIVVAAKNDVGTIKKIALPYKAVVVLGGDTRTESVQNGLKKAVGDIVLIHDAARPFVTSDIIERCISSAEEYGSGVAAVKVVDSVKRADGMVITGEEDRKDLYFAQTPQAFSLPEIRQAYNSIRGTYSDDSAVYATIRPPRLVEGNASNKKITYPEDLITVPMCQKVGIGLDFHRLGVCRKLIVGGEKIPYEKGLVGHSDADVLTHAVMDALLSASGNPDIGVLFPCVEQFRNADSIGLLKKTTAIVKESGYSIISISCVIIAKEPKMSDYIPSMRMRLASAMGIEQDKVNISATTTEGLGIIGNGNGMAASAVALLQNDRNEEF